MSPQAFPELTLTEILDLVESRGYRGSFHIEATTIPPGLHCSHCRQYLLPDKVHVTECWRFEGASDPDDEAILFVFDCPRCATPGTLVCSYGPATSAAEAEVVAHLDSDAHTPTADQPAGHATRDGPWHLSAPQAVQGPMSRPDHGRTSPLSAERAQLLEPKRGPATPT